MSARQPLIITDRYDALGPPNGCPGPCEGTGWVPVRETDPDPTLARLWGQAEAESGSADGWHLVPCPECQPEVMTPS